MQAGTEAQPEGRQALQAEVRGAGREGAEQLHRSGEIRRWWTNQLVVEVTDNASDQGQLIPMVDVAAEVRGNAPAQVLADANYCNERDLEELEARDIDGYVAVGREGKAAVKVDPKKHPAKARMAEKLATEDGRRRYGRRKWMAEAPIGWIKEVMGFPIQLSREGPRRVDPRVPGAQCEAVAHASGGMRRRSLTRSRGLRCLRGSPRPPFAAARPSRSVSDPDPQPLAPRISQAAAGPPTILSRPLRLRRKLLGLPHVPRSLLGLWFVFRHPYEP